MDYRSIIESRYNRASWLELLHDIFKGGANFRATPIVVNANSHLAAESLQLGTIKLADQNSIAVYEIKLSDSVDIVENRVGIRNLLMSDWKMKGCVGAFMFCYRDNESVLRFSYVSSAFKFNEEGKMEKDETDTKRYTYLLGEGHRCRTAIMQFEALKRSKLQLADLTAAFSIEALSDRFFDDYKRVYEDIIEHVTGKRMVKVANKWEEKVVHAPDEAIMNEFSWFEDAEKAVRDYVKRLMGRIVFLQFIQKKGWLGVPVGKEWGEGDKEFLQNLYNRSTVKDNFIDGVLELLFNDINTKRANDIANPVVGHDIKIPYLNGGLFEQDKADECTFRLPKALMDKMFTFFSAYNFTIDENDPDDAEIGVDPEMLGRIFENLLEDNKDKGAFYTPKEIVQYMCKESLIAYLQTGREDTDKDAIRGFVSTYKSELLSDELKADVDEKLKSVKICDPAIGSGAFPMGLLKELFACRSAIEGLDNDNAADIKKHIIQNNIYGVDIEKGAVDIARLRFWLALIVDEKTPHALPNMDFKIMQGNSLIPTFNGKYVNLSDKLRHVNSSKIRDAKKELFDLQSKFYDAEGDTKKDLLVRIKYLILEIVKLQMDYEYKQEVENSTETLNLFDEKPTKTKAADEEKARIVGICNRLQGLLSLSSRSLNEKAELSIPFFDWSTMFSDVLNFKNECGFDIVISNPPYIKELDNKDVFDSLSGSDIEKKYHTGKMDYWYYFLHKGIELSRSNSIICFITSRYWIKNKGAKKIIKHVKEELSIKSILDIGSLKVFDNVVGHHMVTMFSHNHNDEPCAYKKVVDNIENIPLGVFEDERLLPQATIISSAFEINVEDMSEWSCEGTLGDFCDVAQGVVEASDKISSKMYKKNPLPGFGVGNGIFVLDTNELAQLSLSSLEMQNIVKYLGDGDIQPFVIQPLHTKFLIYSDKEVREKISKDQNFLKLKRHLDRFSPYITSSNKPYGLHRCREKQSFTSPKIIGPSMFKEPEFAYDNEQFFCGMSYNVITLNDSVSEQDFLYYILGLLNSNYAKSWFYANAKHRGVGVDVGVSKLREFPVPSSGKQETVIRIVKEIINNKHDGLETAGLIDELNATVNSIFAKE